MIFLMSKLQKSNIGLRRKKKICGFCRWQVLPSFLSNPYYTAAISMLCPSTIEDCVGHHKKCLFRSQCICNSPRSGMQGNSEATDDSSTIDKTRDKEKSILTHIIKIGNDWSINSSRPAAELLRHMECPIQEGIKGKGTPTLRSLCSKFEDVAVVWGKREVFASHLLRRVVVITIHVWGLLHGNEGW